MKQPNRVKAAMRAGRKAYGYNLSFLSPWVIDILGKLDFDFVCIDGEHGRRDSGRNGFIPWGRQWVNAAVRSDIAASIRGGVGAQAGTVSLARSKLYTRAVLPPAILACSSSGTPARISARIFRDWGNVD